jgi:membrane fusion protein, macrolide-specific efflux system
LAGHSLEVQKLMPFDSTALKTRAKQIPVALKAGFDKAKARYDGWSRRTRLIALAVAGAVLLGLAVLGGAILTQPRAETVTAVVQRQNIERTVVATGVLEPARLVSVGAQVSGQVRRLHVTLGQTVKRGDLIAEIDSTQQQNSVATAQASLANVRAQRAAAAATLQQAQSSFSRQTELLAVDAVSRADYEEAQASLASARGNVAALDAQVRQANVALNDAQVDLGYTRIVAPMDGTIVAIVTEEGRTVNANQTAPTIVKLAQLDTMTVSAEISEADVVHVSEGQSVYFTTLGNTDERHYATVRAIAPAPESIEESDDLTPGEQAVYYNALFDVDNADGGLRTGMTATVYVVLESAENALVIPSSALSARGSDGAYEVRVQTPGGAIEARRVKTGVNTNSLVQVTEGLAEGERVVVAQADASASAGQNSMRPPGGMMMGAPGGGGRP